MWSLIKRRANRHRNNKTLYYVKAFARELVPGNILRSIRRKKLTAIKDHDLEYIQERVNYYNKLSSGNFISDSSSPLSELKIPQRLKVYYFDTKEYTRYFDPQLKVRFLFGDITHVPDEPTIVKSRPIQEGNSCSVLLNLNKVRHFNFVMDKKNFVDKKNKLVGRAVVKVPHRVRFYEMYFNHYLCELGQINTNMNQQWIKSWLTIQEQLEYKFVLCIEGYDVASNLKWVMSSNSLAVMPKPKFETWFMEGKLIPDYHYVVIKDDYSDLEDRLLHFIQYPEQALCIVKNANAYIRQFQNKEQEDIISLMVLEKYFMNTGQIASTPEEAQA